MVKFNFFAFGLLALFSLVAATDYGALNLKYDILSCRVDAVSTLVDFGENSTNLSANFTNYHLERDLSILAGYVANSNRKEFNNFVKSNLSDDLKTALDYLKEVKKELVKGKESPEKNGWKEYFANAREERNNCIQEVALSFAKSERESMGNRTDTMEREIEGLKARGINASKLELEKSRADENLAEIDSEIQKGGAGVEERIDALRSAHLQIWARFHIEKLRAVLDYVYIDAAEMGYGQMIEEILPLLDDADYKAELGRPYDSAEFEEVKQDLRDASAKLMELLAKMRAG